jgi:hypothetical protein
MEVADVLSRDHHHSVVGRNLTWQSLSVSLPEWEKTLAPLFLEAAATIETNEGIPPKPDGVRLASKEALYRLS